MPPPVSFPFASVLSTLYAPDFKLTYESTTSVIRDFLAALQAMNDPREPPDCEFEILLRDLLRPALAMKAVSGHEHEVNEFVQQYFILSRRRQAEVLAADYFHAKECLSRAEAAYHQAVQAQEEAADRWRQAELDCT